MTVRLISAGNLVCDSVVELWGLSPGQAVDSRVEQSARRIRDAKLETFIEIKQPMVWRVNGASVQPSVNSRRKSQCHGVWWAHQRRSRQMLRM